MSEQSQGTHGAKADDGSRSRRWVCVCAYDGTPFSGWQSQRGGNAIQDVIERRLATVLKVAVRIHASGRTDAGVHAKGQVFHFDADWRHGAAKLAAALRAGLPGAIQIRSLREGPAGFHARFSATGKTYTYRLFLGDPDPFTRPYVWALPRKPELARMRAAASALVGKHDFAAYSAFNGSERETTERTLRRLDVAVRGRKVTITAEADGFLYKMVRSLVGAVVAAGEGKLSVERIRQLLVEGRRTAEVQTAPPQGLFLERVDYGRARGNSD
ncbi:tRNA pseudouridine synthase A [mine drainage metagenome]|uniref:tRNA pseudouridine synthase A n=1 Tax=mine drainage metagenome TaxID=410659 RepID=A0A1J5RS57_9ZZZZ